jgi:hypothetical protein
MVPKCKAEDFQACGGSYLGSDLAREQLQSKDALFHRSGFFTSNLQAK